MSWYCSILELSILAWEPPPTVHRTSEVLAAAVLASSRELFSVVAGLLYDEFYDPGSDVDFRCHRAFSP